MINNDFLLSTLNTIFNKDNLLNYEIFKYENKYIYEIDIPGIKKENVLIEIYKMNEDTKILNISCKRNLNQRYELKSLRTKKYGDINKKITLPNDADHLKLTSNIEDGVLCITIPLFQIEISSFSVK